MFDCIDAVSFFRGNNPRGIPEDTVPPDFNALTARARSLDPSKHHLKEIAAILEREHRRLGADAAALEHIASIGDDTVFVVCGQQAALFGGPLYTLYKAMHAVRLAERLSDTAGRTVIPLFWVASDDHDFEEVRRIFLRTGDGQSTAVDYSPDGRIDGAPVGDVILDGGITDAVETLTAELPSGEFAERYAGILRDSWKPGVRWPEAFSKQMLRLFEGRGLVVLDPRWSGVKELFKGIFRVELDEPLVSVALVNEQAAAYENSAGRGRALRKPEGSTNLFLEIDGVRRPLLAGRGQFTAGEVTFTPQELSGILESAPGRFSPAAALRPVCQDALLPVAALIAGPGERVYLGQLDPIYDHFGVDRSIPWPRASFTVADRRVLRTVEKEGVDPFLLFNDYDRIRAALARDSFPEGAGRAFDALEETVASGFDAVADSITAVDPTLVGAARKEAGKVAHIIRGLRDRAERAHKASLDISERRIRAASYFLLPDGSPQERRFGTDSILTVLGEGGFEELLSATSPDEERHRIVLPAG